MFMARHKKWSTRFVLMVICSTLKSTDKHLALERLKAAYPEHIFVVCEYALIWNDGTVMPLGIPSKFGNDKLNQPSLLDQLEQEEYRAGEPFGEPQGDPGRIRYEPFFSKMYGSTPDEVAQHLVEVPWMPRVFGEHAPLLRVTTIHNIHEKIKKISEELEQLVFLHPDYKIFLENPGGTYCWRYIANTNRLSNHSFGMTIDINSAQSHYWQWDLKKEGRAISEDTPLAYRNTIPWAIVEIFEKHCFIWGGKWYHYDTMHFEYRPELIV